MPPETDPPAAGSKMPFGAGEPVAGGEPIVEGAEPSVIGPVLAEAMHDRTLA